MNVVVYTDGSCREQMMAAGVHLVQPEGFGEALHLSIRVRGVGNASMAEQAALLFGILLAGQATSGIVRCDDRVLVEAVNGKECRGAFGARVCTIRSALLEVPHVAVEWVQGHGTDLGNRRADKLAREGLPPMGMPDFVAPGIILMDPVEPTYPNGYHARVPRVRPARPRCSACGARASWPDVVTAVAWTCNPCLFAIRQSGAGGTRRDL